MPPAKFKKKCPRCRKNYVIATYRTGYVVCYDCQKDQLNGEITDPKIKELFDIPEGFYKKNAFLRDIKINYLKWKNLSEKQIEAFKKSVKKMEEEEKEEKKPIKLDESLI